MSSLKHTTHHCELLPPEAACVLFVQHDPHRPELSPTVTSCAHRQVFETAEGGMGPDSHRNIAAFLAVVTAQGHIPAAYVFSEDDLMSAGWEDRPRIAHCVLYLKRLAAEYGAVAEPAHVFVDDLLPRHDAMPYASRASAAMASAKSARGTGISGGGYHHNQPSPALQHLLRPQQSARMGGSAGGMFQPSGGGPPALPLPGSSMASQQLHSIKTASGVQRLMQQCSLMLQQNMPGGGSSTTMMHQQQHMMQETTSSSNMMVSMELQQQQQHHHHMTTAANHSSGGFGSPAGSMSSRSSAVAHRLVKATQGGGGYNLGGSSDLDAVGPVLESVLSGLTQEYEKRLLAKDHEITETQDRMAQLGRHTAALQGQLAVASDDLAAFRSAEGDSRESEAEASELRGQVEALQAQVAESSVAHDSLLQQLQGQDGQRTQHTQQLEAQVTLLSTELAGLAGLQGRYRTSQDECRRLYNQVQDLRGAIRVFCRVRPRGQTGDSSEACVEVGADGDLSVYDGGSAVAPGMACGAKGRRVPQGFKFDRVFDVASNQEQVYEDTQPLIRSVLDGALGCTGWAGGPWPGGNVATAG